MAEDRSWKSSLTAMEVAVLDVGLIIVAWLGSGMAFYYFCDEGWTPAYSVFFAVNVGLGVGYGEFMPTRPATKYFTSFYCLVGTSVVMGGLAVLFTGLQTKAKQASFTEPRHLKICGGLVEMKYRDIAFLVYFLLYAALIAVGIWIGYEYEGYTDFADALLFTVTNYTTSGLLQPKLGAGSLVGTTVSLLFGIPFNALFWGEVASRYFARIYRKKTCVDRGARKKTRSRAPAPPRRAPMKLRPARALFSLCLSLSTGTSRRRRRPRSARTTTRPTRRAARAAPRPCPPRSTTSTRSRRARSPARRPRARPRSPTTRTSCSCTPSSSRAVSSPKRTSAGCSPCTRCNKSPAASRERASAGAAHARRITLVP